MTSRMLGLAVFGATLLTAGQTVYAQTAEPPTAPVFPYEILFSLEKPYYFGTTAGIGVLQDGDVASGRGFVLARNAQLVSKFGPPQTYDASGNLLPVDYGLDALFEMRFFSPTVTLRPNILFSVKKGFHSSTLNVDISDGDLLSDTGRIVATNAQLMGNFHPMPPLQDMGLDAVYIPYFLPTADSVKPPEIWFSTTTGWFDEKLGRYISDGDLLSSKGYVVATNAQLLRNFLVPPANVDNTQPSPVNMGLDAVYVVRFRPWDVAALTAASSAAPQIWFSVSKDFTDKYGRSITSGDLLSASGAIVRKNQNLLANFPPSPLMDSTDMPLLLNYGLDAVHVRGRNLIAILPSGQTVPRTVNNIIRLVFDGPVTVPDSEAFSLGGDTAPQGSGSGVGYGWQHVRCVGRDNQHA